MHRCVLLNFELPWNTLGLELRPVFIHLRFMHYLGLAQCHTWVIAGCSISQELGLCRPPAPVSTTDFTDLHRSTEPSSGIRER